MDREGLVPWKPASGHRRESSRKQCMEDMVLKPFLHEQQRQESARRDYHRTILEATVQMRDHQRKMIHESFQKRMQQKRLKEFYDHAIHSALQRSWQDLEQQDFTTLVGVHDKVSTCNAKDVEEEYSKVESEIYTFESKGYELGTEQIVQLTSELKTKDKTAEKGKDKTKQSPPSKKDPKVSEKSSKAEDALDMTSLVQVANTYLEDIKKRVTKETDDKFQLEQKLRKEALDQQQRDAEQEELRKKTEEDEIFKRKNEDALCLAEQEEKAQEQELVLHRLQLQKEIEEQRNREWDAILARDREMLHMMQHDSMEQVLHEQRFWKEEKLKKIEKRKIKHKSICIEILYQIASLAESTVEYKLYTNCLLPMSEWREWKKIFFKGAVRPFDFESNLWSNNPLSTSESKAIDEETMMEYLQEQGEWKGPESIGQNRELGKILSSLFDCPDEEIMPPTCLSRMNLKVAVVGSPYSGKTTVSKLLESEFGTVHLEVEKVIASAVAIAQSGFPLDNNADHQEPISEGKNFIAAEKDKVSVTKMASSEDKSHTSSCVGTILPMDYLAREALNAACLSLHVPDEVTVQLLLHSVQSLEEGDKVTIDSRKKKDESSLVISSQKKKRDALLQNSQRTSKGETIQTKSSKERTAEMQDEDGQKHSPGFVIDGYPTTQTEAEILMSALTGRNFDRCAIKKPVFISLIAPPPKSDANRILKFPLDAVFMLQPLDEDEALQKATGKCIDPKTGILYHLEDNPPPANDKTGIAGRLKPVEDARTVAKRISEGAGVWKSLLEWMRKFSNAYLIQRDSKKELEVQAIRSITQSFVDARIRAFAASNAAKSAIRSGEAASQAWNDAESACLKAEKAAQKLLSFRVAEVEASALLDPNSKEILKKKASEAAGAKLQEITKLCKEANDAAESAKVAAVDAQNAAETAKASALGIASGNERVDEAVAAADAAKQAEIRAFLAAEKAGVALENASSAFSDIENIKRPESTKETSKALPSEPTKEQQTKKGYNSIVEMPETVTMEEHFTVALKKQWQDIEEQYLGKLNENLKKIRIAHSFTHKLLKEAKEKLIQFLKQPDERQKIVEDFQDKYNRVEADQRQTLKMKKQLQKKAEELGLKLQSICEGHYKEVEALGQKSLADWIEQRMETVSLIFIDLIQLELDRYLKTSCFLHEYYFRKSSSFIQQSVGAINVLHPIGKQQKLSQIVGWLSSIAMCFPQLQQAIQNSITISNVIYNLSIDPNVESANKNPKKGTSPVNKTYVDQPTVKTPGLHFEQQILLSRFQLLATKACSYSEELQLLFEGAQKQVNEWKNKSRDLKSKSVEEVMEIVEEAIEESIPLWYHIILAEDNVYIDEHQLAMDPQPPLGLKKLPDLTSWHFKVLEELVAYARTNYSSGFMPVEDALEAIRKIVDLVHNACNSDVSTTTIPHIPKTRNRPGGAFEVWVEHVKGLVKVSTKDLTLEKNKLIDWRTLLPYLVDKHYNYCLSLASLDDIQQACNVLDEKTKESQGMISLEEFLNTNLWFDIDDNFNLGSELKKVFFIMFQEGDHVQWRSIMAYLCRDTKPQVAFQKALTVLKGSISQNTEIRPEELLQVVYPCDIQKALSKGCSILSLRDFKVLLKMAKEEVEEHDCSRTREDDETTCHSTRSQMGSRMCEATRVSPRGTGRGNFPHSSQTHIPRDEENGEKEEEEWERMSEFSEETAVVLKQFLASCYSPNIIHTSSSVHVSTKDEEEKQEEEEEEENKITLQDILTSKCKGLHSILNARFDPNGILMFQ